MGAINPSFLFDLESRLQVITETEYNRLSANLWWQKVAKVRPSVGKRELYSWLLSTATIDDLGTGGSLGFEDLVVLEFDVTNKNAGKGLKLRKQLFEDMSQGVGGKEGIDLASQWAAQIGAYMAYWPQKQIAALIKAGGSTTAYDSANFFATTHYYNPYNTGLGSYANDFTSSASGQYPGYVVIDESVSLDVAATNLAKAFAYIRGIKMPNGVDPRMLKPAFLLGPPRLGPRMALLSQAQTIAMTAGSNSAPYGGGSVDFSGVIKQWDLQPPVIADELAYDSTYTSADTTFYIAVEQMASTQLGALIYQEREPFKITYYSGDSGGTGMDAVLSRADELEWHCHGRNAVSPGHPYLLFRCQPS